MKRFRKQTDTGYIDYAVEDEVVYARPMIDTNIRAAVLARNAELRRNEGAVKTTSFGKLELDIPLVDMPMLNNLFPGMADPADPRHKTALRAFMRSPASVPYRLQEQKRGVNRGTHITA